MSSCIARYPVCSFAQSAFYFTPWQTFTLHPLADLLISMPTRLLCLEEKNYFKIRYDPISNVRVLGCIDSHIIRRHLVVIIIVIILFVGSNFVVAFIQNQSLKKKTPKQNLPFQNQIETDKTILLFQQMYAIYPHSKIMDRNWFSSGTPYGRVTYHRTCSSGWLMCQSYLW